MAHYLQCYLQYLNLDFNSCRSLLKTVENLKIIKNCNITNPLLLDWGYVLITLNLGMRFSSKETAYII